MSVGQTAVQKSLKIEDLGARVAIDDLIRVVNEIFTEQDNAATKIHVDDSEPDGMRNNDIFIDWENHSISLFREENEPGQQLLTMGPVLGEITGTSPFTAKLTDTDLAATHGDDIIVVDVASASPAIGDPILLMWNRDASTGIATAFFLPFGSITGFSAYSAFSATIGTVDLNSPTTNFNNGNLGYDDSLGTNDYLRSYLKLSSPIVVSSSYAGNAVVLMDAMSADVTSVATASNQTVNLKAKLVYETFDPSTITWNNQPTADLSAEMSLANADYTVTAGTPEGSLSMDVDNPGAILSVSALDKTIYGIRIYLDYTGPAANAVGGTVTAGSDPHGISLKRT